MRPFPRFFQLYPDRGSCPRVTRPTSPAFRSQKGGIDLNLASPLGLGLGSLFAPCLVGHGRCDHLSAVGTTMRMEGLPAWAAPMEGRGQLVTARTLPLPRLPSFFLLSFPGLPAGKS